MACMCGDTQCPSCGPAQGNSRCIVCGAWADDGCTDPAVCASRIDEVIASNRADEDALAAEWQWEKDHAKEIAAAIRAK